MNKKNNLKLARKRIALVALAIAVLAIFLFFLQKSSQGKGQPVQERVYSGESLRVAEVSLPGMFCKACALSSEASFKAMDGVLEAEVDIRTKKGRVVYNSAVVSKEQLVSNALIKSYDGKILSDRKYSPLGDSFVSNGQNAKG